MSEPAISVEDVCVTFAGVRALTDVTFQVGERELLGLIGPNGAGKTTLVNVISGFQRPRTGSVSLFGEPITNLDAAARGRLGLARTFQGVRLFGQLSVLENIEVSALGRARRGAARAHAREAIRLLGLEKMGDRPAGTLPYGDQRRLAIARCLAMQPKVLLMDEPAAGLNEEETIELGEIIGTLRHEHGLAIILIEHDVALVMRLSDRILVLAGGRPLAVGLPDEIRKDPAVEAAYLGVRSA